MYQQYFSGSPDGTPINLDDMSQELELKHRMMEPARDTFLNVQGIVWGLLKFECFARFKVSDMYHGKLTKQEEADLKEDSTVVLLDEFLEIRKQEKKGKLKAPKMPTNEKELDLDDNLYDQPDIEEMFEDEDLMLAFREYLYHTHVQENLAFWLETELYRRIDDSEERGRRANEIVDKFCRDDSPYIINCEESLLSKIIKEVQKKPLPNTFRAAQKMTWRGLKNEWFPQFCVSEMYKEFDRTYFVLFSWLVSGLRPNRRLANLFPIFFLPFSVLLVHFVFHFCVWHLGGPGRIASPPLSRPQFFHSAAPLTPMDLNPSLPTPHWLRSCCFLHLVLFHHLLTPPCLLLYVPIQYYLIAPTLSSIGSSLGLS